MPPVAARGINEDVQVGHSRHAAGVLRAPGEGRQPALRSSGLLAAVIGPVAGFSADPAPASRSAIGLDDLAPVNRDIEQLPLLALRPVPDGFGIGGQAGNDAGAATALPEQGTMLLLGLGLLGLFGARRVLSPALPA